MFLRIDCNCRDFFYSSLNDKSQKPEIRAIRKCDDLLQMFGLLSNETGFKINFVFIGSSGYLFYGVRTRNHW
jgi:hypothetical protein